MDYNFPVTRTTHPKPRPADESKLGFAKYFTDHMFVMDWDEGQGWHDGRIVPHAPIEIEPASCVLHYAQMMFEGMKAYKTADGHSRSPSASSPSMRSSPPPRTAASRRSSPAAPRRSRPSSGKTATGSPAPPARRCISAPSSSAMRSPSPSCPPSTTAS